jgi:hypothetical protein
MPRDRILTLASLALRLLFWVNLLCGLGFVAALLFTLAGHETFAGLLARKYAGTLDIAELILAMRAMLAIGIAAVGLAWPVITRLQAMIATVAQGDPFIAANARRLQAIGWALLGWQLLDLVMGAVVAWIARIGADVVDWTPSLSGWIVVLLVFVLARVFAVGTAMRDDLEGTV